MPIIKKKELVSIIINCYNGEKYLAQTIKSVLRQTYRNWEIIFFDNNSKDNSVKIIKKFKDKRIKFYTSKNKFVLPLYRARNLAITKAKGEFITFLDVDDTWKKNKLDEQLKLSTRYPLIKIFYSNFNIFNQKIKKSYLAYKYRLPSGYITQNLVNRYCVGILTLFISRNIFKKYKFNEKFNVIGDFDLIIRLSNKFKIISHQKSLANYRMHKSNYSKNLKIYLAEMRLWLKYNENKLKKNNINLTKIKFFIFKLKIKSILKKLFNLDF